MATPPLGEDASGIRRELSEGQLIVTPSPTFYHNKLRDVIAARLRNFLEANQNPGQVITEMDFQLGIDTVRRPDVALITAERMEGGDEKQTLLPFAPDMAVEIVAPTDGAADLLLKVVQYFNAGTRVLWVVYPDLRLAYRYAGHHSNHSVHNAIEERDVFPGFRLALSEIL